MHIPAEQHGRRVRFLDRYFFLSVLSLCFLLSQLLHVAFTFLAHIALFFILRQFSFPALLVSLRSELCHCSGYSDNFFSLQGSGLGCLMLSNLSQPPRKPSDNFRLWTIGHGFYFLAPDGNELFSC